MAPKRRATDIDDSDDDDGAPSFGRQILPVAALPDGFDGEPADGLEYLFTVRSVAVPRRPRRALTPRQT
jgi:hypothetical protein